MFSYPSIWKLKLFLNIHDFSLISLEELWNITFHVLLFKSTEDKELQIFVSIFYGAALAIKERTAYHAFELILKLSGIKYV